MVSIIVLSYHAPADLRRCIASVLRTDYPPGRFRLVVVDNEATEETAAACAEFVGKIDVLPQRENFGYAEGMNIGIRHALTQGAQFVVCLNQDTEVHPQWLRQLVMAMETEPMIGAVQPRIMLGTTDGHGSSRMATDNTDGDVQGGTVRFPPSPRSGEGGQGGERRVGTSTGEGHTIINSIGNEIHVLGFAYAGGHRERWEDVRKRLRGFPYPEVTYCSGAAVMFRTVALADIALQKLEVGGEKLESENPQFFDSSYFMYHEDVDLGVRLRMRRWKCALAPQGVVTHYYKFSRSVRKLEWMERNRLMFLYENFRWPTLLLLAPALLASEIALALFAVRGGWWDAKRRAWGAVFNPMHWGAYHRARAARQAKRRVQDRIILRLFTPRFANQEIPSAFVERIVNPLVTVWWRIIRPLIGW